jgi:hypothetical protein
MGMAALDDFNIISNCRVRDVKASRWCSPQPPKRFKEIALFEGGKKYA